jgi:hypothetical protein
MLEKNYDGETSPHSVIKQAKISVLGEIPCLGEVNQRNFEGFF